MSKAFFCAVAFSVATSSAFAEPLYTAIPLEPYFVGYDMNSKGQIVGRYNREAAMIDHGQMQFFSPPFSTGGFSECESINEAGQVVVSLASQRGYLYSDGTYTPLADDAKQLELMPFRSGANISPTGAVAGYAVGAGPDTNGIYENGSIQVLDHTSYTVFNSAGDYLTSFYSPGFGGTIHHANGTTINLPVLPGADYNALSGFNRTGDVIGIGRAGDRDIPFIYAQGQFTILPSSAELRLYPTLITDDGTVFGSGVLNGFNPPSRAFIYKNNTLTYLDDQTIANNQGAGIGYILGIDANGNLLASYRTQLGWQYPYYSVLLVPTDVPGGGQSPFPEPTTLTLLPLALLALRLRFGRSQ